MGLGLNAVRDEIRGEFGAPDTIEHYDSETMATVLGFAAEGRRFVVRLSDEFDEDYGSGQLNVDLSRLGQFLRASKDGKATIRRSGIST